MSILASLARAYERLPDAPPFGYSSEKVGYLISLNEDGTVAHQPIPHFDETGKKRAPHPMFVPQAIKRTSGVAANFLWDKTSYVLGVTAAEGKSATREHAAFIERHLRDLAGATDPGLRALVIFLKTWFPRRFEEFGWPEEMKDQNVVFCLETDRKANIRLHDRPSAKALWARLSAEGEKKEAVCLVTGERGPVAKLHPSIKGVWGSQSSGASIVSLNAEAYESYNHKQGDNAPVSEAVTFAYTTALNRFLEKDSGHRIQIGDASVVFWADASEANKAAEAENIFAGFWDDSGDEPLGVDEGTQAKIVGAKLEAIRRGETLREVAPELAEGVRFYVLGLAPNSARLSIRFYFEDDFGAIAANYQRFLAEMRIEPPHPRDAHPALWKYLVETAVLKKRENVPCNLAGEWVRAILAGARYPQTLFSTVLMRVRADKDVNALRVAILKAVLKRNFIEGPRNNKTDSVGGKDNLVALDPENKDQAYVLGRLFAVLERIQLLALGKVNATIRDRYFEAASSKPSLVFPTLLNLSLHHRSKAEKDDKNKGLARFFAQQMAEIFDLLNTTFPAHLSLEDQGKFAIGYYHQFNFRKSDKTGAAAEETAQ